MKFKVLITKFGSIFTFIVSLIGSPNSVSMEHSYSNNGNVGLDVLCSDMRFKEDFGSNIMSNKLAPGLNLFASYMFNQHIGAEVGFEFYKKMHRTVNKAYGMVAGINLNVERSDYWVSYKTTMSQKYPYIGVIIKHDVSDSSTISLLTGASLSSIKAKYVISDTADEHIDPMAGTVRTFSKTNLIPMIKAIIEHKFNEKFSVRATVSWKQTSSFKTMKSKQPSRACIKPRDSFGFGVGVKYYVF